MVMGRVRGVVMGRREAWSISTLLRFVVCNMRVRGVILVRCEVCLLSTLGRFVICNWEIRCVIHFNFREIRGVVIRRVRGLVMGSLEAWLIQP